MTFFNIFSKKPEKTKEKERIKIIIDNRERNSLVPSELASLGFQIEFKQLDVADYLVNETAIERKTVSDLKSSIINKRIITQLLELKQYPQPILILEGFNENMYQKGMHENAFRGFLLSVILEFNIPLIFTLDEKDTARYISILAKKTPKTESSLRPSKILHSKKEELQFILEGFPNIGPKTAKKLLKEFNTLKNIVNASESELAKILGKRASNIKEIITYNYK